MRARARCRAPPRPGLIDASPRARTLQLRPARIRAAGARACFNFPAAVEQAPTALAPSYTHTRDSLSLERMPRTLPRRFLFQRSVESYPRSFSVMAALVVQMPYAALKKDVSTSAAVGPAVRKRLYAALCRFREAA